MDHKDISIINGIVLENILEYVDVSSAMKLSAVCKRWYEIINSDTVLWNRLVQLEQIEDPEYWNRVDDNDQWTLGTPCKPKNILINYRKTCFSIKHNIYKEYVFNCDKFIKYDGKTLLFTKDRVLHIYKMINNNLELFQTIDLSIHGFKDICVYTNTELIVITDSNLYENIGANVMTYRLEGNRYVDYIQRSFDGNINYLLYRHAKKLLHSHVFILTCYKRIFEVLAWNIPENRIIFNAPNQQFIKHDNGIVYTFHTEVKKFVLYNEKFEVIYRETENFGPYVHDIKVNDNLLLVENRFYANKYDISLWDKATGLTQIGSKSFDIACASNVSIKVFFVNDNIVVYNPFEVIQSYDAKFQLLWSHQIAKIDNYLGFYYIFNKLVALKQHITYRVGTVEFRDVNNGNVLLNIKLFIAVWKFEKDMIVSNLNRKMKVLLYR